MMRAAPLAAVVLLGCTEPLLVGVRPGSGGAGTAPCVEAAVAIRDDVPDYQKQLTEQFTVPLLEQGYDRYWYFTESTGASQERAFVAALDDATLRCRAVDVFLLAHGNHYVDWVAQLPPEQRRRIRLAYNTGGGDGEQGPRWLDLGVQAYVGHPGSNIAPLFYVHLLPAWISGRELEDVVKDGDETVYDGLFGRTSGTILDLVRRVGFNVTDPKELWEGTRASVFGDRHLQHTRPAGVRHTHAPEDP